MMFKRIDILVKYLLRFVIVQWVLNTITSNTIYKQTDSVTASNSTRNKDSLFCKKNKPEINQYN